MKKLFTALLILLGLTTYGQTTINPDTVVVYSQMRLRLLKLTQQTVQVHPYYLIYLYLI